MYKRFAAAVIPLKFGINRFEVNKDQSPEIEVSTKILSAVVCGVVAALVEEEPSANA